jgi:hypothetical protein
MYGWSGMGRTARWMLSCALIFFSGLLGPIFFTSDELSRIKIQKIDTGAQKDSVTTQLFRVTTLLLFRIRISGFCILACESSKKMTASVQPRTEKIDVNTKLAADRTRLAYERTLMAWVRTAISLITFGFTI